MSQQRPHDRAPLLARWGSAGLLAFTAALLVACATPSAPVSKTIYDFGEFVAQPAPSPASPALAPLALAEIQASWGQNSTAMLYRLAYANELVLMPYQQARWSMPPTQLVAQRMRAVLGQQRPVVSLGDSSTDFVLQISLENFGQSFESPTSSKATVQLRATLLKGDQLIGQRDFTATTTAPTADAAGGARGLGQATQSAATDLAIWVSERMR
jgi:cholesterol transport system auxiliary component